MMTVTHPLVADYLHRLERAAAALPRSEREELVAEIRSHLDTGLAPDATEADVRNLLDDLGTPDEIVAVAAPTPSATVKRGAREAFAVVLLLTGLPPFIGWVIGVGLLLWSPLWTARQKALGVLVWPGGLILSGGVLGLLAARTTSCVEGPGGVGDCGSSGPSALSILAIAAFVAAPIIVAAYLYRAAGRQGTID